MAEVAVAGATGALGSKICHALLARGAAVRALVRDDAAGSARALADAGAELVWADITERRSLEPAVEGFHDEVVLRDHRLRRERHDLLAQVDLRAQAVDERHDEREPRTQGSVVTAQPFHDAGTSLRDDAYRPCEHRKHDDDQHDDERHHG